MTDKPENPPAFPIPDMQHFLHNGMPVSIGYANAKGMTLRDYFAAAALTGILANSYTIKELLKNPKPAGQFANDTAIFAYEHADAMLLERSKNNA